MRNTTSTPSSPTDSPMMTSTSTTSSWTSHTSPPPSHNTTTTTTATASTSSPTSAMSLDDSPSSSPSSPSSYYFADRPYPHTPSAFGTKPRQNWPIPSHLREKRKFDLYIRLPPKVPKCLVQQVPYEDDVDDDGRGKRRGRSERRDMSRVHR